MALEAVTAAENRAKDLAGDGTDSQEDIDAVQGLYTTAAALVSALPEGDTKAALENRLVSVQATIAEAQTAKNIAEEVSNFTETYSDVLDLRVETVSITDKDEVNAAITAYEGLSEAAKCKLINEKALLDDLLNKIE